MKCLHVGQAVYCYIVDAPAFTDALVAAIAKAKR